MSERIKGFTVSLAKDISEEGAEALKEAMMWLKGVIDVAPQVSDFNDQLTRAQVKHELREKLWKALE